MCVVILFHLSQGSDQKTCCEALEVFNPDLYAPNCNRHVDGSALHLTAVRGFAVLSKEILTRGFHQLLKERKFHISRVDGKYTLLHPAAVAVQAAHFSTAKVLLQAMEPRYSLCLH